MGHLVLAENAKRLAGLGKVVFMPVNIQPFKQDREVTSADDRLRMLAAAIRTNPGFDITRIELERSGVSYTIDSVREFASGAAPDDEIAFILGADMFMSFEKWYKAGEFLREFELVVGKRPGTPSEALEAQATLLREKYGARITLVGNPLVEVSGTDIRGDAAAGATFRYLVPDDVWRYLFAKSRLPERKFAHTKRVMDLAVRWAKKYGVDTHKAWTAALLHDIGKDGSKTRENNLGHGRIASQIARDALGVSDADVLNAIRWHTTARAHMSKLEMIVFSADTVEPGRKYDGAGRLRALCEQDLERGTLQVLVELDEYLRSQKIIPTADTLEGIAYLSKIVENRKSI
jgi:nicotinate-nucleotide adenylyltransferase